MEAPIIFIATYVLLLIFPKARAYIAIGSGALFILLGILPVNKVLGAVDWNVILMIAGIMGIVHLFIQSGMPSLLAERLIHRMPDVRWVIVSLALFAGIVSAFMDNVATVLMVAPVALVIAKTLGISPVTSVLAIAVSSNLQGAATLVGDTTSILLGGAAKKDFLDFFFYQGKPGMFFVVQAGALLSALVLFVRLRDCRKGVMVDMKVIISDLFPTFLLICTIALLILASFFPGRPPVTNGLICMGMLFAGILRESIKTGNPRQVITELSKEIDFSTLLLLSGLFVVIAGVVEAGMVADVSRAFVRFSGGNIFLVYSLIVWASVVFSAFIDNIPYVAAMLPVTAGIAAQLSIDPTVLFFGLLAGATLGGNLSPIGASANITAMGILRKNGFNVKTREFMSISVPFTMAAVITGYVLIWLFWGAGAK